jgi:peptide chain release factor subunit 1
MSDIKRKRLEALIQELEKIRGRHTELVTVYVPQGFNLAKVVEQIRSEQSTAQNIKSKAVRKNVLGALERVLQHLKLYRVTPDNGMVIFCGNVSEREGVSDLEIWAIEPPEPINQRLYRCDQIFILDALKEMVRETELYGLIVLDKSEADIGLLSGKKIQGLKHMESIVPGKTKAGGWSANRYARIREGLLNDFLKKIGEVASSQFKGLKDLKGVLIGGSGPIKNMFADGDFLDYEVGNKVIGVVDTSYMGDYGMREMVERAEDILVEASVMKEKKILDRYFGELEKDSGLAVYGLRETVESLKAGNLDLLLVSEAFDWVKIQYSCNCNNSETKVLRRKQVAGLACSKCKNPLESMEEIDLLDEIVKQADSMGTTVEMISVDTQRGVQLKELGGIGGVLRYKA